MLFPASVPLHDFEASLTVDDIIYETATLTGASPAQNLGRKELGDRKSLECN